MHRALPSILALAGVAGGLAPFAAADAAAQETGAWNSARALDLVERAAERRGMRGAQAGISNFQARADGHVYFYLDRRDTDERTLVKADQIALELYWAAPDRTRQHIVGMRDISRLPNRMRYHLDHLIVVLDEFGDVIRLGDGDEVRDVPHPAAPGARGFYDYRLADSLTLRLPGRAEPVRVYQVEVRPRDPGAPAFVGSLFLDRESAHIARMTFTFTPASYVDRRLEHIHVSLENGLWQGRHWLPHEQRLEIRRQIPELDIPAASVIRGVMRIGGYEFDQDLAPAIFVGPPVTAVPREQREAFEFPVGLFDALDDDDGLLPVPELADLRRQAVSLLGRRHLSALPRLRPHLPGASSALRYNRAEGVFLGGGAAFQATPDARLEARLGYATGAAHVSAGAALRLDAGRATRITAAARYREMRDMGVRDGANGVLNTILTAAAGQDRLDPFYASGGGLELRRPLGRAWRIGAGLAVERHEGARLTRTGALFADEDRFRPVRTADEGWLTTGHVSLRRAERGPLPLDWHGGLALEAGVRAGDAWARPVLELAAVARSADRHAAVELRGAAGIGLGEVPAQRLFLLGGAGTLPGYPYRGFAGDRFVLAELEASRDAIAPWLRLRGTAAVGWTGFGAVEPPADWPERRTTGGVRASIGAGAGLFYDLLRIDLGRGLRGGGWRLDFSVHPQLRDVL